MSKVENTENSEKSKQNSEETLAGASFSDGSIEKQLIAQTAFEAATGKRIIWMPDENGRYCARPAENVAKEWVRAGTEDEETALKIIYDSCSVEHVWKRFMLPPGKYTIEGEPHLVRTDLPFWVDSEPLKLSLVEELNRIAGNAFEVALTAIFGKYSFHVTIWIAGARVRIKTWRTHLNVGRALPALAIVGEQGAGKSLFVTQILPRLLGAPGMDLGRYATGNTDFTGHIEGTPLLTFDDTTGALSPSQRKKLGIRLKAMQYGGGQEIHLKGRDPLTLKMPWAPVICCNSDVNSLRAIPLMSPGDAHKILILPAKNGLPCNRTEKERALWDARFMDKKEIQAFINVLDLFGGTIDQLEGKPGVDTSGRQFVQGGCPDAEIAQKLADIAPAGIVAEALAEMVDAVVHGAFQSDENLLKGKILLRQLNEMIQNRCTFETRKAFNSQLQTHAEKKEALKNYLESLQTEIAWSKKHRDYALNGVFWKIAGHKPTNN